MRKKPFEHLYLPPLFSHRACIQVQQVRLNRLFFHLNVVVLSRLSNLMTMSSCAASTGFPACSAGSTRYISCSFSQEKSSTVTMRIINKFNFFSLYCLLISICRFVSAWDWPAGLATAAGTGCSGRSRHVLLSRLLSIPRCTPRR